MHQLPNEETSDYDDLEDVNVCLEQNRDDQVDELVQRSFRKIKRKEEVQVSHLLKWLLLFLLLSVVSVALFQYFVGFSSRKANQQQHELVGDTVEQKVDSQKIGTTTISDVKTEPKKEDTKVQRKDDSNSTSKLVAEQAKKEDSATKVQTNNQTTQKKISAQNSVNTDQNKKDQKVVSKDEESKKKEDQAQNQKQQQIQKQKQAEIQKKKKEEETQKQKQKLEQEKKQQEKQKQKQKLQQEQKEKQRKQQQDRKQKQQQDKKQKQQQEQQQKQKKQKQQEERKQKQRKQKEEQQQTKQKQQQDKQQRQKQKQIEEQKQRQRKKQEGFAIPRNLWTISARPNYFQVLVGLNHERFAQASGFTKKIISKQDYTKYLSDEGNKKLENLFNTLEDKIKNQKSNLGNHIQQIQKNLILLSVLYQNGGIIVDDEMTVTENFDWVKRIDTNPYVNRGNRQVQPKIVGFYSPYYSSPPQKFNKKTYSGMEEVDKYTVLIPTIENYFLAAEKKAEYIGKLIDECIAVLQAPQQIRKDVVQKRYSYIHVDGQDVYYQYFMIASQRILLAKQKQLDSSSKDSSVYNFAFDYFGLNLINCYYGPYKTTVFLQSLESERKMQIISNQDLSQLQSQIGPLRYVSSMSFFKDLSDFLSRIQKKGGSKRHKVTIMKGSFLQKMYFPNSTESFILQNPQKSIKNQNAELWIQLPKKIWIFWDTGLSKIDDVPAEVILCVQNLKRIAEESQFKVYQINDTNIKEYLSESKISKIEQALDNFKDQKNVKQIRCDLYRLAVIEKHGGVYVDTSVIAVQNFNWLRNIARLPSNMIENRHGELPEVLLFWDPYFGEVQWKINEAHHTKSQWLLQYQNSFIAATKDSQFIKEWLDLFLELSEESTSTIVQTFEKCNVPDPKQLDEGSHSLLSINTAKCVLGRKQQSLKKSSHKKGKGGAMDYYRVWTINSLLGPFKFKAINNLGHFDKSESHYFLTRYSQQYMQGIFGKINFLLKLTGSQRDELTDFLKLDGNLLKEQSHPQSIFRKYLSSQKYSRFQTVNDRTIIKVG